MARKGIDIIYNFVRKRLAGQAPKGIVTKLPESAQIEQGMQEVFKLLKSGNINPVSADNLVKTEDDLAMLLNKIVQDNNRKTEAIKKADAGITRVFDKMKRNIPLNPDDQAALQGSGFKTALDNFKGFEPKVIEGGKNKPPRKPKKAGGGLIKAMAKLKKKYGKDIIQKGKAPKDRGGRKKLRQMFKDFEKRTEKKGGGVIKFFKKLIGKKKTPSEEFEDYLKEMRKKSEELDKEFYKGLKPGGELDKNIEKIKEGYKFPDKKEITKKLKEGIDKKKLEKFDVKGRKPNAGGGLAYMLGEPRIERGFGGSVYKFLKALSAKSPAQRYKEYLASVKKRSIEGDFKSLAPELGAISAGGILVNRKMKKILEEGNELQKERFLKEYIEELNNDPSYDDRPELRDKLIEKYTESLFGEKRADGGRIGFADGGMSRRTFLKIMAALAAFPVVGKLAKTTKIARGAKPIVTPTAEMPAHFPKLVEKIIREGQVVKKDFVKKTGDVTTYKHPDRPDIELTIEGDGKRIQLDFETDQGMKAGYEFRQGEIIDDVESSARGKRAPNEFDQGEVKYRTNQDGSYTKDFEEGIDTGTENLDEFAGVGKQETSKSKVNLPESDDFADGGLAGLLGE